MTHFPARIVAAILSSDTFSFLGRHYLSLHSETRQTPLTDLCTHMSVSQSLLTTCVLNSRWGLTSTDNLRCPSSYLQLPLLLSLFSASWQGWDTHSYLESIEADHALAVRNVVVSENLLPLLLKQRNQHVAHLPPHKLRVFPAHRVSENSVCVWPPPFTPNLTSISSYSTSVPSRASATFLRVCKILQQSSRNT